jgi:cytochrome c peroxidase
MTPTPSARRNPALCFAAAAVLVSGLSSCSGGDAPPLEDAPEVLLGERLFLETRFAQYFAANHVGVNEPLPVGDPAVDTLMTPSGPIPGPFAGRSMSCRQCHLVDDAVDIPGGISSTYADFAARSPVSARSDGQTTTPRNSPPLVNASLSRSTPFLLHFDGQFATGVDLVRATLAGRNFGWLPGERAQAVAHVAAVVRGDDGSDLFAEVTGGLSYARLFESDVAFVPYEFRLPPALRLDVQAATDEEIFDAVATLIDAYVAQIEFSRDENGDFNGSPFDAFLRKNGLPLRPNEGESDLDYSRRLRAETQALVAPQFVVPSEGELLLHDGQPFEFGATELQGLLTFLSEPSATPPTPGELAAGGIGNCVACHAGPQFTDFLAHNVGSAQEEYDSVHGAGTFAVLSVPNLAARALDEATFLPASHDHPTRLGVFRRPPTAGQPQWADLGAWSVFGDADEPGPQSALHEVVARAHGLDAMTLTATQALDLSLAMFKTPGLRSLGQGGPYFHTGRFATLTAVVQHYLAFSGAARASAVRNADPQLGNIAITGGDVAPLVAFLRSLNEDYQ